MKRIIIGLGTGRCGTRSLSEFLSKQPNTKVTHESIKFRTLGNPLPEFDKLMSYDGDYIGDVAYWWVKKLWLPMENHPWCKAICLWRRDDEVVESFWNFKKQADKSIQQAWYAYPFDSDKPNKDAIARAVRKYRALENRLFKMYPGRIERFRTEDLNNEDKLNGLLDWLEYSESGRILVPVHTNKQSEVIARSLQPKRLPFWAKNRQASVEVVVGKPTWLERTFRRIKHGCKTFFKWTIKCSWH